jgi:hypothetical protein
MLLLFIIVLIGFIFYQAQSIKKLNKKILMLQKELQEYKDSNFEAKTISELKEKVKITKQNEPYIDKTQVKIDSTSIDSTSSRNLSILITGSILIILAAIVFLTTAWKTIPDFIKTITLFLVTFVFLGASKISKAKYHLEKASKTFFYISMAYLPICLLSIFIFGLFGTYFSITGEGKYIYLGFSTLILAILYYFISKKSDDKNLFYGSLLSQLFSVILFTLMFEERIFLVFINLLLYNLLLILITKDKIFKTIINILPGIIAIGTIMFFEDEIGSWYFIFTSLLLAINFIILEFKKSNILKSALFNLFMFIFGFSLIFKMSSNSVDRIFQFLGTLFTLSVFVIEHLLFMSKENNKNMLISTRVSTIISMGYLYLITFSSITAPIIPDFIMAIILEILLIINLKSSKNLTYKYLAYAFSNILLLNIHTNFFEDTKLINYIPLITTTIIMFFEMYCSKEKSKKSYSFLPIYLVISEALALCTLRFDNIEVNSVLTIIFTIFVLYYNNRTNTNQLFNAVPLIFSLPCILDTNLNNNIQLCFLLLSTIGLTYLSVTTNDISVYTIISGIYLIISNSKIDNIYVNELLYIVWSMIHVCFCNNEQTKDVFKVLASISITSLYYSIVTDLKLLDLTLFKLLGIIICGMYVIKAILSKYEKENNVLEYTFWTFAYLYALVNYTNSKDGIIFSILILAVIFLSYYKKYGATFLAGIIAILVNAFALTRKFWFSIPWWIYLLVIGSALVGFAIKNEANEKKEKITIGSVLKGIKDKVENK